MCGLPVNYICADYFFFFFLNAFVNITWLLSVFLWHQSKHLQYMEVEAWHIDISSFWRQWRTSKISSPGCSVNCPITTCHLKRKTPYKAQNPVKMLCEYLFTRVSCLQKSDESSAPYGCWALADSKAYLWHLSSLKYLLTHVHKGFDIYSVSTGTSAAHVFLRTIKCT